MMENNEMGRKCSYISLHLDSSAKYFEFPRNYCSQNILVFLDQMGEPTQRCISCAPVQRLFDGLILWNIESCSSSA